MVASHVRRSIGEHILHCSVLVTALFIMSLDIALSAKASLGTITILMHLSFVAVQAALLKRQFRAVHLLQIPVVFVFAC